MFTSLEELIDLLINGFVWKIGGKSYLSLNHRKNR